MSDSIYSIGLRGIMQGLGGAVNHSVELSRAFSPEGGGEPADAIIGLKLDELQVKASAKVIKVAEKLDDSVLDILA